MRTLHLALAVSNIEQSVADYTARLGVRPVLVVPDQYALWRTSTLNLSIRKTNEASGTMRHLGWEDTEATEFSNDTDCNGIVWENLQHLISLRKLMRFGPVQIISPEITSNPAAKLGCKKRSFCVSPRFLGNVDL